VDLLATQTAADREAYPALVEGKEQSFGRMNLS
jgi:hypothetical protein